MVEGPSSRTPLFGGTPSIQAAGPKRSTSPVSGSRPVAKPSANSLSRNAQKKIHPIASREQAPEDRAPRLGLIDAPSREPPPSRRCSHPLPSHASLLAHGVDPTISGALGTSAFWCPYPEHPRTSAQSERPERRLSCLRRTASHARGRWFETSRAHRRSPAIVGFSLSSESSPLGPRSPKSAFVPICSGRRSVSPTAWGSASAAAARSRSSAPVTVFSSSPTRSTGTGPRQIA